MPEMTNSRNRIFMMYVKMYMDRFRFGSDIVDELFSGKQLEVEAATMLLDSDWL